MNNNNLQTIPISDLTQGQRVIIIDGIAYVAGIGGLTSGGNNDNIDIDFTGVNVTSDKILSGIVAINENGEKVIGNIQTVSAIKSNNKVTIPKGYIDEQQIITVGTEKSQQTYTPKTTNQIIEADTYLTGVQTIKGDTNLVSENIKNGVTIFNVKGNYVGSGGGSSSGSSIFDLAKITEYVPAHGQSNVITQIEVSELGYIGDQENEVGGDYSGLNGVYYLTEETKNEENPLNKRYKHESEQLYLWCDWSRYEDGELDYAYWFIGPEDDSGVLEIGSDNIYENDGELSSGVAWVYESEQYYQSSCQIEVTKTHYQASETVINGLMVTEYNNGEWTFDQTETSFDQFENEPVKNFIYVVKNGKIIGNKVDCPYPLLMMPLDGRVYATQYGEEITPKVEGNLNFDDYGAVFNGNQSIQLPIDVSFFQENATICFKIYQTGNGRYGYVAGVNDGYIGLDNYGGTYNMWLGNSGWNIIQSDSDYGRSDVEQIMNQSVHIAYIHDKGKKLYRLYINGIMAKEIKDERVIKSGTNIRFGCWGGGSYKYVGKMKDVRIYDKVLTENQLNQLAL